MNLPPDAVLPAALLLAAAFALLVELAQILVAARFFARRPPAPASRPPISVLKPLCGLDDGLRENLASFLAQDYPDFELLLGVASERDAAWPLAADLARVHPGRVRVVLQRGEPGLNPKVNQLVTLCAEARHPWVLISDSNVRVGPGYLDSVAAHLADERVGLVTHPVAGTAGQGLGSRLDNLHLTASVLLGVVSLKQGLGLDIVVGKSMALRKADVAALGGFEAYADLLAEDFVIGQQVRRRLGKQVALAGQPVFHVTEGATLRTFWRRFTRWSVMQRRTVGLFVYGLQIFQNPTAMAALALAVRPSPAVLRAALGAAALRCLLDGLVSRLRAGARIPWSTALLAPFKDVVVALAWAYGLVVDRIDWRGHPLRVTAGSRLEPLEPLALPGGRQGVQPN